MNELMNMNSIVESFLNTVGKTVPSNLSRVRIDITMIGESETVRHALTLFKNGNINHHIFIK